jgi:hypothetical protein
MSEVSEEGASVGIVVVHGVLPHPRYQIQDDCAANLRKQLEDDPNWTTLGTWVVSVLNPRDAAVARTLQPHPTVTRVRLSGDDPVTPARPHFDVIEAYWSPLDKGKATFTGVIAWLLRTVFVPLNTTARYMAKGDKTAYDVVFVTAGIAGVVLALLGALWATVVALDALVRMAGTCTMGGQSPCPSAWQVLSDPGKLATILSPRTLGILALAAVGAYLLAQGVKGLVSMFGQHAELARHPAQRAERWRLIAIVLLTGAVLFALSALIPIASGGVPLGPIAWWFVGAASSLELGLTVAKSFIVNFFADVEIYTTRDENSDYFAMREKICELATTTIAQTCSDAANGGKGYDRVFVMAHSLGSTIALDALIRFSNLREQAGTLNHAFERLRGFVTFGSPLEKTKYFFDVMNPSPSAGMEQWRNDAYGVLFTADAEQLEPDDNAAAKGIFWGNYWYFKDAIANELASYRSFLAPKTSIAQGHHVRRLLRESRPSHVPRGHAIVGRLVCRNERGHKGFVWPGILPHGEYLGDDWFWRTDPAAGHLGALDIVARWRPAGGAGLAARTGPAARTAFAVSPPPRGPGGATFDTMPEAEARKYADRVPPPESPPGEPDESAP